MFGKESIYGQLSVTLDEKNRIILPKFTYVEPKETLLVVDKEQYLSICREEKIDKIIKDLERKYVFSSFESKKEIDIQLLKIYRSILKKVQSDNQHRISLGGIDIQDKKILCIGAKDSLILDTKIRN